MLSLQIVNVIVRIWGVSVNVYIIDVVSKALSFWNEMAGSSTLVIKPKYIIFDSWRNCDSTSDLWRHDLYEFHHIYHVYTIDQYLWSCCCAFHSCWNHFGWKRMVKIMCRPFINLTSFSRNLNIEENITKNVLHLLTFCQPARGNLFFIAIYIIQFFTCDKKY